MTTYLEPIHPGEILFEEFLQPMGISINRLARDLEVPPGRISTIVNGKRLITADTALRLGMYSAQRTNCSLSGVEGNLLRIR